MDGGYVTQEHPAVQAIEDRLRESARTLRRLALTPRDVPMDTRAAWPDVVQSIWEAGLDPEGKPIKPEMRPPLPSAAQIDRMNETFLWLYALPADRRKLVWARAMKVRWKLLEYEFGLTRRTLSGRYRDALLDIVGSIQNCTSHSPKKHA